MDVLSAVSSIVAILHASAKVIEYVNTAHGATKDRARLRKELRACNTILQQIKDEADDSDEGKAWTKTIQTLQLPDGPLHNLEIALKLIEAKLTTKDGLRRSLKWPFQEKEVLQFVEAIEREKALLDLALSNNSRKLIQEIERRSREHGERLAELTALMKSNTQEKQFHFEELKAEIEKVQLSQTGLHDGVDHLHERQNQRDSSLERQTILDWISPIDHVSQQQDVIVRRQIGTGQWFLNSANYKNWVKNDSQTMFCPGIPGAGKTIVTSIIVDNLREHYRGDATVGIAYVYCNFRKQDEQTVNGLFGSLLKQLADAQCPLSNSVNDFYNHHILNRTQPTLDDFSGLFQKLSASFSRIFILVDALDECDAVNGHRAKFVSELFRLQRICRLNFVATSRFILDIADLFKHCSTTEIRASTDDVRTYLENHMDRLPKFVNRNSDLQEEIKAKIVESTEGMFLLAKLHLDSLIGKKSPKAIKTALSKLATGSGAYDSAYNDAMTRIEGQAPDQEELAKQVLAWIVCAKRPLRTLEFQEALGVEVGEFEFDQDNCPEIEDMVSVCAGLVTVDKASDIIRLVHYTTQEYFDRTKSHWFPDAEAMVTEVCITYLSLEIFRKNFKQTGLPGIGSCEYLTPVLYFGGLKPNWFYYYAVVHWSHHARAAPSTCALVLKFFERPDIVELFAKMLLGKYSPNPKWTRLHLSAFIGLKKVTLALLQQTHDINPKDCYDYTPLHYAAKRGSLSIVKLLVDHNATVDSYEVKLRTPLSLAAKKGHKAIVTLLLDRGADVNVKDTDNETPLNYATRRGNEGLVKILLDHDADASCENNHGQTSLTIAAGLGFEIIVRMLLDHGADINCQDSSGFTPLSYAAMGGEESIIKILLERGADVNLEDGMGHTPLTWALFNENKSVIKMLLDHGAIINEQDSQGTITLLNAVFHGQNSVVNMP